MQIYKGCKRELGFSRTKLNGIIQANSPVAYAVIFHVEHKINFNPLKSTVLYIGNYW